MTTAQELSDLLRAAAHPLRLRIMHAIAQAAPVNGHTGGASPVEIQAAINQDALGPQVTDLAVTAYHVRKLVEYGLLYQAYVARPRGRGKAQHFYAPTELGRQFIEHVLPLLSRVVTSP